MKTLAMEDDIYIALEEEASKVGWTVSEMVVEAIADTKLDERERAEIESARAEAADMGGVEAEAFFDQILNDRS